MSDDVRGENISRVAWHIQLNMHVKLGRAQVRSTENGGCTSLTEMLGVSWETIATIPRSV